MKIGLFGLPQVGKTTVFKALSGTKVLDSEKSKKGYKNRAIVKVPEPRLDILHKYYPTAKKVNATIEYVEIGGIRKKENKEAISDSLLGDLRTVDSLAHVVRAFKSNEVPHVYGDINPLRDIEELETTFILSDLSIIEKSLDKLERYLKANKEQELKNKKEVLLKCKKYLEEEIPLREIDFSNSEKSYINSYQFLSQKPLMIILNIDENTNDDLLIKEVMNSLKHTKKVIVNAISGKLEMEISELEEEEQKIFIQELGLKERALDRFIKESFNLLGLIQFFTIGDKEVRAWTIPNGTKVIDAAGVIHTDLKKGFIRAEVSSYEDFINHKGSLSKLKEKGKLRLEGKDYIVKDGDIITIRFNVKR